MRTPQETRHPLCPKVILVGVDFTGSLASSGASAFDAGLTELSLLSRTAGYEPVGRVTCKRRAPDPALFVGSGKADEIKWLAAQAGAAEVLFDQALSPAQQRNLEQVLGMPVNDRTMLILTIFAQRARSHEGKLQVELARLQYLSTRLKRRWSHLERQSGGIGMRGGPGEKQIELDRRMITEAIAKIKVRLAKVKRQRSTQRRQRERRGTFAVSIVGYTNAGKSTLFNALTKANAYAADQLFATLDPTTRQIYLGADVGQASLSDTVGFIRDLPHDLIEAFEATLREATEADLLLHVVDAANPSVHETMLEVQAVLRDIGAGDIEQVIVCNKIDALESSQQPLCLRDRIPLLMKLGDSPDYATSADRVFTSARCGTGLAELRGLLSEKARARASMRLDSAQSIPNSQFVPSDVANATY